MQRIRLFFLLFLCPLAAHETRYGYILAPSGLNIRESHSSESKILGSVPYQEKVELFGDGQFDNTGRYWTKIKWRNIAGWAYSYHVGLGAEKKQRWMEGLFPQFLEYIGKSEEQKFSIFPKSRILFPLQVSFPDKKVDYSITTNNFTQLEKFPLLPKQWPLNCGLRTITKPLLYYSHKVSVIDYDDTNIYEYRFSNVEGLWCIGQIKIFRRDMVAHTRTGRFFKFFDQLNDRLTLKNAIKTPFRQEYKKYDNKGSYDYAVRYLYNNGRVLDLFGSFFNEKNHATLIVDGHSFSLHNFSSLTAETSYNSCGNSSYTFQFIGGKWLWVGYRG